MGPKERKFTVLGICDQAATARHPSPATWSRFLLFTAIHKCQQLRSNGLGDRRGLPESTEIGAGTEPAWSLRELSPAAGKAPLSLLSAQPWVWPGSRAVRAAVCPLGPRWGPWSQSQGVEGSCQGFAGHCGFSDSTLSWTKGKGKLSGIGSDNRTGDTGAASVRRGGRAGRPRAPAIYSIWEWRAATIQAKVKST